MRASPSRRALSALVFSLLSAPLALTSGAPAAQASPAPSASPDSAGRAARAAWADAVKRAMALRARPDALEALWAVMGSSGAPSAAWREAARDALGALDAAAGLEVRAADALALGALGGFAARGPAGDPLVLVADRLGGAPLPPAVVARTAAEELGHWLDAQVGARLGAEDALGDEGQRFAALLLDAPLTPQAAALARVERDQMTRVIDGVPCELEAASIVFAAAFRATRQGGLNSSTQVSGELRFVSTPDNATFSSSLSSNRLNGTLYYNDALGNPTSATGFFVSRSPTGSALVEALEFETSTDGTFLLVLSNVATYGPNINGVSSSANAGSVASDLDAFIAATPPVFENGVLKFGPVPPEASVLVGSGALTRPALFDPSQGAYERLTGGGGPLELAFAAGGDGAQSWNLNGDRKINPTLTSPALNSLEFVNDGIGSEGGLLYRKGYGALVKTGSLLFSGGERLSVTQRYELASGARLMKVTTTLANLGASSATNVRFWVGSTDDEVDGDPTTDKQRGDVLNKLFTANPNPASAANAIKLTSTDADPLSKLLFSPSPEARAYIYKNTAFDFGDVVFGDPLDPTGPASRANTSDGYGIYFRIPDLAPGASRAVIWYVLAGDEQDVTDVIQSLSCAPGFVPSPDQLSCVASAVDECANNTDNCSANATCTDTAGGFTCQCNPGYTGDGVTCADIDECANNTDNCHANATCDNSAGGFTCQCNPGYTGDGVTCADIDECANNTDNCSANATCDNSAGGFTCPC
ncbi:MAG: hypothetical protein FJ138_16750, partial [Deltaproteobacteria bacterium]|nr:hypothetical protein [Deltaproteobacteria bacterium]